MSPKADRRTRSTPRSTDASLLEPIFAAIRKLAGKAGQADANAFASAFYRRLTEEELPSHDAQGWAALAHDLLGFAARRKRGTALVRLFNPAKATHGWESPHTVLQIVNDDMPFLVDSVSMALADMGIGVHVLGHPIIQIGRDRAGRLTGVGEGDAESVMHLEIDRQTAEDMARIEARLREVLADVRAIVADWDAMRERMRVVAADLGDAPLPVSDEERAEARAFLDWAADDHFTFFGYREYALRRKGREELLVPVEGSGLGLLRGGEGQGRPLKSLAAHNLSNGEGIEPLVLTKTNARSSVHRPGYMDYIGVLGFDGQGRAVSERRFLGLYTSGAYNRRPWDIPLVRQRYERVMAESGLKPTGHSGKALKHILETLPRDELFQSSAEELYRLGTGVLGLQERVRSKLFLRRDRYGRFYSVLVYIPRERFNTEVRHRVEAMLRRVLHADHVDANVLIGDSPLAQVHLIVRPRAGEAFEVDQAQLERELAAIVRNWQDDLRDALVARHGEQPGLELAARYGRALPAGYIEDATPAIAATDVERLAALRGANDLQLSLQQSPQAVPGEGALRLKLYRNGSDIALSDALPMMENLGLRVVTEHPYRLEVDGGQLYIQDFEVEANITAAAADRVGDAFAEAFTRTWRGDAENDGFNRLVLGASLDWRQVALLRGYAKYLQQVGVPFSQSYVEETFANNPLIARMLVELFEARFDPAAAKPGKADGKRAAEALALQLQAMTGGDPATLALLQPAIDARLSPRAARYDAVRQVLKSLLDGVSSLDEDRILRSYMDVIDATLRTSFYQRTADAGYKETIAFKFDPARVPDLPKPRPYREIFVYGPRVEGTHLRFGPVARGGLRWSDRREDFRTEVLGLVKAQMVKNTVIVPVGSKGGFIVKRPPAGGDRDALFAEGVACYRLFISGMLDITDNIVEGRIVPPAEVVRHDQDDPYLVVAADKGTATFSDTANGIAREYGFWLDDAFASGGSVGYDHKGMGITARGAWESVKRHFRALGHDSQAQDFTSVGIGDMSGDVFGNGMLLSRHIRLVAAFDHRHIFIDPDPDAERSYLERERMFRIPRSSWADYDARLISRGGGVYPRSLKSIDISPQACQALGLPEGTTSIAPNALLSAILKAPVDLLWNGGIGTYVKGSAEQHSDVGDRANNAIRVDGRDLRCKVVGEGGNLGFTQLGRIEAARNGVLLNTDFIDNSAGVDTSDHEVNLKILLDRVVKDGDLTEKQRNHLLADMTDEVAGLVLRDNYEQNLALANAVEHAPSLLHVHEAWMRKLKADGVLNRELEALPSSKEVQRRLDNREGLTAPELSVLMSWTKIVLADELLESEIAEDHYFDQDLRAYFPAAVRDGFPEQVHDHPLRREIIVTQVVNDLVNGAGMTFWPRLAGETGASAVELTRANFVAREIFGSLPLREELKSFDNRLDAAVQTRMRLEMRTLVERASRWLVNNRRPPLDSQGTVDLFTEPVQRVMAELPDLMSGREQAAYVDRRDRLASAGVPEDLASRVAVLPPAYMLLNIVEIARREDLDPTEVARVHFALGERLGLPGLVQRILALPRNDRWQTMARAALRDDLHSVHAQLTAQVLAATDRDDAAPARVVAWEAANDVVVPRASGTLAEICADEQADLARLSVGLRVVRGLLATG